MLRLERTRSGRCATPQPWLTRDTAPPPAPTGRVVALSAASTAATNAAAAPM